MSATAAVSTPLARTPLHALHVARGARMVPFAGYEMPVQYPAGVLKEHLHTRAAAGLFDVSHMGQIALRPKSGDLLDAARALERLIPQDIQALPKGRQRYAQLTNERGGIRDDLMVSNCGDHLFLVVNAACKVDDEAHLRAHLSDSCAIETLQDRALVALQGPKAEAALAAFAPAVAAMAFMDCGPQQLSVNGRSIDCVVSRSGYTGEDGFEISLPAAEAEAFAVALLNDPAVLAIGLGARDSLRLEAGLCLYGHDIDETTTPVEAGLAWSIQKSRRSDGLRPGGFTGSEVILDQLACGVARRRVGLRPEGRAPVRDGAKLFSAETSRDELGAVVSGGFGPSLNGPIAMGYLPKEFTTPGTLLFAEVRGQRLPIRVAALPFIPHSYKR